MGDDGKSKCCCIVLFVVIILLGGGGTGIYFAVRTTIKPTSAVYMVPLTDGHYAMGEYQLTETSSNGAVEQAKLILTQVVYNTTAKSTRRLSYEGQTTPTPKTSEYKIHATLSDSGFRFTFNDDQKLSVQLDVQTFAEYLANNNPEFRKRMEKVSVTAINTELEQTETIKVSATATTTTTYMNQTETIVKLQNELAKIFDQELNTTGTFKFSKTPMVDIKFNSSSFQFQPVKGATSNRRRLLLRRILFITEIFDFLAKTIKQLAIPTVNLIRRHGPQIGKIAGGLVGGALGGVEGFSQGVKIGEKVGVAAQAFFEACIPENTLVIKCTVQGVTSAVVNISTEIALSLFDDLVDNARCGTKKCVDLTSVSSGPTRIYDKRN